MYIVISSSSIEYVRHREKGASRLHRYVVLVASRGSSQCSTGEGERKTDVAIFSISTQMTTEFVLRPTDKRSLLIVALLDYLIGQTVKWERNYWIEASNYARWNRSEAKKVDMYRVQYQMWWLVNNQSVSKASLTRRLCITLPCRIVVGMISGSSVLSMVRCSWMIGGSVISA